MLIYILVGILMFGLLVAVHEGGHFLAAKLLDVQVNEFAIGMGPLLFSRQVGETAYSLRLLPIGGFCAMEGEDGYDDDDYEDEDDTEPADGGFEPEPDGEPREPYSNPRAFSAKAPWKRLVILAAGPASNLVAGFLIAAALFSTADSFMVPVFSGFMDGVTCVGEDGLLPGDRIVSVNGTRVFVYADAISALNQAGDTVDMTIRRDGRTLERPGLSIPLREYERSGQTVLLRGLEFTREDATLFSVLRYSADTCCSFSGAVWTGLRMLAQGDVAMDDMSGPVGIVSFLGEAGSSGGTLAKGMFNVFYLVALIAVNLAIMNMLPFPALDGGRIFLLLAGELIFLLTRRRIPPRYEAWIHFAGLILLLGFMLVITINDVGKLFH